MPLITWSQRSFQSHLLFHTFVYRLNIAIPKGQVLKCFRMQVFGHWRDNRGSKFYTWPNTTIWDHDASTLKKRVKLTFRLCTERCVDYFSIAGINTMAEAASRRRSLFGLMVPEGWVCHGKEAWQQAAGVATGQEAEGPHLQTRVGSTTKDQVSKCPRLWRTFLSWTPRVCMKQRDFVFRYHFKE